MDDRGGGGGMVESTAFPAPLTGIVRNGSRDGFDPGPGKRLLRDAKADANADGRRGAGEMGIIGRDRREFHPQGEEKISTCGSGNRRTTTVFGRPRAGAWRKGPPPPPIHHHPYGGTPRQIWVPGDDGC